MASRHRRADLAAGLQVKMLVASGGASITRATGPNFQDADITSVSNATGDYTITINPFKGPKGEIYCQATCSTSSKLFATIKSATYTNDSLAVNITMFADTGTATDTAVFLDLYAE